MCIFALLTVNSFVDCGVIINGTYHAEERFHNIRVKLSINFNNLFSFILGTDDFKNEDTDLGSTTELNADATSTEGLQLEKDSSKNLELNSLNNVIDDKEEQTGAVEFITENPFDNSVLEDLINDYNKMVMTNKIPEVVKVENKE